MSMPPQPAEVRAPAAAAARRVPRSTLLGHFVCRQCGRCCEGDGTVRLQEEDCEAIARLLGLDPYEFTRQFTRLGPFREALELTDRDDGACVFLTAEGTCRIQAAKPRQCRDFPAGWSDAGMEKRCAGMILAKAAGAGPGRIRKA